MIQEEIDETLNQKPETIDSEDVAGGVRPTLLRYTSKFGILMQQITYSNPPESSSWGAIQSIGIKEAEVEDITPILSVKDPKDDQKILFEISNIVTEKASIIVVVALNGKIQKVVIDNSEILPLIQSKVQKEIDDGKATPVSETKLAEAIILP